MILLIDNYDSFTYNLYQAFAGLGEQIQIVRNDQITLQGIAELAPDGIILSPGPGRPEDAGICMDIVRHFNGEIPILGVCLGHQAIAACYGGNVVQSGEIVHGKATYVRHAGGALYDGMRDGFAAARYHSLVVAEDSLPDCLEINARNDAGMIMGIKHRDAPTFGVQFHPESILTPDGAHMCANFISHICRHNVRCAS